MLLLAISGFHLNFPEIIDGLPKFSTDDEIICFGYFDPET